MKKLLEEYYELIRERDNLNHLNIDKTIIIDDVQMQIIRLIVRPISEDYLFEAVKDSFHPHHSHAIYAIISDDSGNLMCKPFELIKGNLV